MRVVLVVLRLDDGPLARKIHLRARSAAATNGGEARDCEPKSMDLSHGLSPRRSRFAAGAIVIEIMVAAAPGAINATPSFLRFACGAGFAGQPPSRAFPRLAGRASLRLVCAHRRHGWRPA